MMVTRYSPWLEEIDDKRAPVRLNSDLKADVLIVGAGIAGTSTAYYLLHQTDRQVIILDKNRAGHGASGRNGGQGIVSIEKSFAELIDLLGAREAANLLNDMEQGHDLMLEMCAHVSYPGRSYPTSAWSGAADIDTVNKILNDLALREVHGAPVEEILLVEDRSPLVVVPGPLADKVKISNRLEINKVLHARTDQMLAFRTRVTLANSGLLSEMIVRHLLAEYPSRFSIFEDSRVSSIDMTTFKVDSGYHSVKANDVVLCTNGFIPPPIRSKESPVIEKGIRQYVASMVAYDTRHDGDPGAFLYHHEGNDPAEEPYYYLTRRPYGRKGHDLVAVGGPQTIISGEPRLEMEYPAGVYAKIDEFATTRYDLPLVPPPRFHWNGLMGYTPNGIRLLGQDPDVEHLWYNLGCNGVGLLPSIVGGKKLATEMATLI